MRRRSIGSVLSEAHISRRIAQHAQVEAVSSRGTALEQYLRPRAEYALQDLVEAECVAVEELSATQDSENISLMWRFISHFT